MALPPHPQHPPFTSSPTPSLLSLNLQGIKSAVKPNWKRNGFVQWEAASINSHLMRRRKAEAETGDFAAVRDAIHYLSAEGRNGGEEKAGYWRGTDSWTSGRVDEESEGNTAVLWPFMDMENIKYHNVYDQIPR